MKVDCDIKTWYALCCVRLIIIGCKMMNTWKANNIKYLSHEFNGTLLEYIQEKNWCVSYLKMFCSKKKIIEFTAV